MATDTSSTYPAADIGSSRQSQNSKRSDLRHLPKPHCNQKTLERLSIEFSVDPRSPQHCDSSFRNIGLLRSLAPGVSVKRQLRWLQLTRSLHPSEMACNS